VPCNSWPVASSSDSAANVGLSPEESAEAAEVITESRAKGAAPAKARGGGATRGGIASEELLGQSAAITPNHEENMAPLQRAALHTAVPSTLRYALLSPGRASGYSEKLGGFIVTRLTDAGASDPITASEILSADDLMLFLPIGSLLRRYSINTELSIGAIRFVISKT